MKLGFSGSISDQLTMGILQPYRVAWVVVAHSECISTCLGLSCQDSLSSLPAWLNGEIAASLSIPLALLLQVWVLDSLEVRRQCGAIISVAHLFTRRVLLTIIVSLIVTDIARSFSQRRVPSTTYLFLFSAKKIWLHGQNRNGRDSKNQSRFSRQ